MRKAAQLALLISLLAAPALGQFRWGMNVDGSVGLGFDHDHSSTSGTNEQGTLGWYRDFAFHGTGFVYDERLLLYSLGVSQGQNTTDNLTGTTTNNYLQYNGNFNFLSERDFPFSIFFEHNNSSNGAALFPLVTTLTNRFGFQGQYHRHNYPYLFYTFSKTSIQQESDVISLPSTKSTNAQVTGTYDLNGWELRGSWIYLNQALGAVVETSTPNVTAASQSVEGDVSRQFNPDMRMDLSALHSSFSDAELAGIGSGNTALNANFQWQNTKKLQTGYFANYTQTTTNVFRVLEQTTGQQGTNTSFNPSSLDTNSYEAGARASYLLSSSWGLHGDVSYNHINFSDQMLASTDQSTQQSLTDGNLSVGAGYSYRHKLWKLLYTNDGSISNQHYHYLGGRVADSRNYSLANGISGGDVRKVRYSVSGGYSHHSSPLLFVAATTSIVDGEARAESNHFNFARLSASFQYSHQTFDLNTSNNHVTTKGISFSATIPSWKLGLYGTVYFSDGHNFLFGTNSPLNQQPGTVPTSNILVPTYLSQTNGTRFGAIWTPSRELSVQTQYVHDRFFYFFGNTSLTFDSEWDTVATYKFGRFTFYGGYSHGSNITGAEAVLSRFDTIRNRFFVQVRFPFHVLGMGR